MPLFDQGLHAAQDPVVDAADPLGRELAFRPTPAAIAWHLAREGDGARRSTSASP